MRRRPSFIVLLSLFCLLALAACGNKGDLVRPGAAQPAAASSD